MTNAGFIFRGLILYREQYLLLETNPHPMNTYDVVGTITHEL
jgi:hypothetical protein